MILDFWVALQLNGKLIRGLISNIPRSTSCLGKQSSATSWCAKSEAVKTDGLYHVQYGGLWLANGAAFTTAQAQSPHRDFI